MLIIILNYTYTYFRARDFALFLCYHYLNSWRILLAVKEVGMMLVTRQAPDFTTEAFHQGKIKKVSLSDYKGKWVVLCFYPGDFTFV